MKKLAFILAIFVASFAASCPPKSIKQTIVQSLQVSETSLEGAQDIERSLCFNTPATERGTVCTNPVAVTVGLTKLVANPDIAGQQIPVHQLISKYFVKAYDYEILAAQAMLTWKAGDKPPASLTEYQAEIQSILVVAEKLIQGPQTAPFVAKLKTAAVIQ